MKAYDDPECQCRTITAEINEQYPDCNWNCDAACNAWSERRGELKNNHIEFEPHSDECYGCTCPTCGRMVCGWCV